jgi:hypothetical protein
MSFKPLYEFKLDKVEEIDEIVSDKNEKGEEIKVIKKVKKSTSHLFALKKPNRTLFDEAELFYGVKLAESIKAGMLTKTLMIKKYDGDGGIFTQNELNRIKNILIEMGDAQKEVLLIEEKKEAATKEELDKLQILNQTIDALRLELTDIENNKNNLFEQTAENRAKNKTMMWWVLNLSYKKDEENYVPFFNGLNYEQKLKSYDEFEESGDEFIQKIMTKFAYFVSFWYSGRAANQEDFAMIEKYLELNDGDVQNKEESTTPPPATQQDPSSSSTSVKEI